MHVKVVKCTAVRYVMEFEQFHNRLFLATAISRRAQEGLRLEKGLDVFSKIQKPSAQISRSIP